MLDAIVYSLAVQNKADVLMRDKRHLKSQSLETTAPSGICSIQVSNDKHRNSNITPAWSRFPFICTAETLLTFLKGNDDAHV